MKLTDVAKYYKELDHQVAALNWLQGKIPAAVLEEFAKIYSPPAAPKVEVPLQQIPSTQVGTAVPKSPPIYQIKFSMAAKRSSDLLEGKLDFVYGGKIYNTIRCTSSLPGRQYEGAWNKRGGLIPPSSMAIARTGSGYRVKTTPIYMPNTIGVSGNFYPIVPFEFETDGDTRGDWGIHNDANVPGSMGCIVALSENGWAAIQREFKKLEGIGIRSVELIVEYS
jgi:hypothetical protein